MSIWNWGTELRWRTTDGIYRVQRRRERDIKRWLIRLQNKSSGEDRWRTTWSWKGSMDRSLDHKYIKIPPEAEDRGSEAKERYGDTWSDVVEFYLQHRDDDPTSVWQNKIKWILPGSLRRVRLQYRQEKCRSKVRLQTKPFGKDSEWQTEEKWIATEMNIEPNNTQEKEVKA